MQIYNISIIYSDYHKPTLCFLKRRLSSLSRKACQSGPNFGTVLLYLNVMGILSIYKRQQLTSECAFVGWFPTFNPTIWKLFYTKI